MAESDTFNWIDYLASNNDAYPDDLSTRDTGPDSPTTLCADTLTPLVLDQADLEMFEDIPFDFESPDTIQDAKKMRLDDWSTNLDISDQEGNDTTITEAVIDTPKLPKTECVANPRPRLVEILRGHYDKYLYNFTDKNIFRVTYMEEEDSESGDFVVRLKNDVTVTVDLALLEEKVRNGQTEDSDITRFLRLILKTATIINIKTYDQPTPAAKLKYVPQPEAIRLNLKQYQLDTLGLMELVETQVDNKWRVPKLMDWKAGNDSITVDVNNRKVYFPPDDSLSDTKYSVSIKGGILADEMGLGKTVTMLALITVRQFSEVSNISLQDAFRDGEEELLHTRATLVIAPNHLTAQWKQEAEQHAPSLNFVLITTKRQFERVSYEDIMNCDLVVVSVQFLLDNKAYRTLPTGEEARASLEQLFQNSDKNPLHQTCPNFCHFNWWRLVCDEAHELITYLSTKTMRHSGLTMSRKRQLRTGLHTLGTLHGKHKWYLSGTPFPHAGKSLRGALKFLEMKVDDEPRLMHADGSLKIDEDISSWENFYGNSLDFSPIHMFILETIYIRNTKKSVQLEYDVPEYIEELMLLTQSEVEMGVYNQAATELERRQLCCHLQIAHNMQSIIGVKQKSLQEVKYAMIDESKNKVEQMTKLIDQTKKDMEHACNEVSTTNTANIMLNNRIIEYADKLKLYAETLTKHKSSLSYFESIVPRITQSAEESCAICLDDIQRLTLTPCGHMYCRQCILQCLQEAKNCPNCRKDMRESDLIEIKDPDQQEEIRKSTELDNLTEQYGTKMAHLIFFLRHLFQDEPSSRVIIFSQWDDMLHKIGSTLDENKIGNVFVKGNVHIRNKAIKSFKEKKFIRVIMLSLQNAASGTNLVEASHVILIDPVAGSKADAVAIESQAIGRAHRMGQRKEIRVVRMIMKNTIEHDLYLRNTADNVQVELDFDWEMSNAHGPKVIRKIRKIIKPNEPTMTEAASPGVDIDDEPSDNEV